MMIHEKLMAGQFLLDFKNDRSSLHPAAHSHHVLHHNQRLLHQQQPPSLPPSPPMPTAINMDLYSAYAYQQQLQLQHHLIGSSALSDVIGSEGGLNTLTHHQSAFLAAAAPRPLGMTPGSEVLDLSRRCDPMETPPRKVISPYQTTSSLGTISPAGSPTSTTAQTTGPLASLPSGAPPTSAMIPANLLYSNTTTNATDDTTNNLALAAAALYPSIYYAGTQRKTEMSSLPAVTPPPTQIPAQQPLSPVTRTAEAVEASTATTPTSSTHMTTALAALEPKPTRPFKAFPRDPLVIAANFAATDVLLDNPRVERYTEYRKRVLEQIRNSNGGCRTVTNPKMRRTNSRSGSINEGSSSNEDRIPADESSDCDSNTGHLDKLTGSQCEGSANGPGSDACSLRIANGLTKDAAYFERRRKNNAAAKKSRDRRRIKEDEIAIRAAYLERQNIELLCQIDALKAQLAAVTSKMAA